MPLDQLPRLQQQLVAWQSRRGTRHVIVYVSLFSVIVSSLFCYGGFIVVYGSLGSVYEKSGAFGFLLPIITPLVVAPAVTAQLTAALAVASGLIDELDQVRLALENEVATRKTAQIQLERLVVADPLTAVFNRRGFFDAMAERCETDCDGWIVATVDIDHFKRVNDTHGHGVGDRVLRTVAETIVVAAGERAVVGRLGGDEFAVGMDPATADPEGLCTALADVRIPLSDGTSIDVACSVGFAEHDARRPIDATLVEADVSMYEAKLTSPRPIGSDRRDAARLHSAAT